MSSAAHAFKPPPTDDPAPVARGAQRGRLQLVLSLEPVWSITGRSVTAMAMRVGLYRRLAQGLAAADPARLTEDEQFTTDLAIAEGALDVVRDLGSELALQLPLHYAVLTNPGARAEVVRRLQRFDHAHRLAIEVIEAPARLAPGALAGLVGAMKRHGRGVIARRPGDAVRLEGWKDAGLAGVSFDFAGSPRAACAPEALREAAGSAAGVATGLIAYGLQDRSEVLAAWAAGFTHVSGAAVSNMLGAPLSATRFNARDLYGRPARVRGG